MKARPIQTLVLVALRTYQAIFSPVFAGACRFYPSCSAYASEAVAQHGVRQGLWLAAKRLLRCRPFQAGPADGGAGGFDPVPLTGEPGFIRDGAEVRGILGSR